MLTGCVSRFWLSCTALLNLQPRSLWVPQKSLLIYLANFCFKLLLVNITYVITVLTQDFSPSVEYHKALQSCSTVLVPIALSEYVINTETVVLNLRIR